MNGVLSFFQRDWSLTSTLIQHVLQEKKVTCSNQRYSKPVTVAIFKGYH